VLLPLALVPSIAMTKFSIISLLVLVLVLETCDYEVEEEDGNDLFRKQIIAG
jgi:hypothetical protein